MPAFSPVFPSPACASAAWLAMGTAAAVVVVGLGAFALLPPVRAIQTAGEPTMLAANDTVTARARRACWKTARPSALPIWWSG